MIRTLQIVENNVYVSPPNPVVLVAATSTQIFPNMQKQNAPALHDEIVQRLIQNCSTDKYLYMAFGVGQCDNNMFHCILGPMQQRDVSNDAQEVWVWCDSVMTVATEVRFRQTNLAGLQAQGF